MYVSTKTLSKFYRGNKVTNVVVKYQYQQAKFQDRAKVRAFVVALARRI